MGVASAVIGALRVVLGADTAQFEKAMTKSQSRLKSIGKSMARIGTAVAAGLTAAATGLAVAVRRFAKDADNMAKLGRALGIPVEELTKLRHAADLSGVSMDGFSAAMRQLARNMGDAAAGMSSTGVRAFDALGVSVKNADGTLRSSTDVMADVADKFAGMEDGAGKTALALALFGRQGGPMINLLNAGSAGIAEMTAEAEKLGLVISGKTARASEAFNDNLTRIGRVFTGLVVQVGERVMPLFQSLSKRFLDFVSNSELLRTAVWTLTFAFKALVTGAEIVIGVFRALGKVVAGVANGVLAAAQGDFDVAWNHVTKGVENIGTVVEETAGNIKRIWDDTFSDLSPNEVTVGRRLAAPLMAAQTSAQRAAAALKKEQAELKRQQDALNRSLISMASSAGEGFAQAATGAREFSDVLRDIASQLASTAIRAIIPRLFGAPAGLNFAGGFASGGVIPSGSFGLVGEGGMPELVEGPARVTPMDKMGGGLVYAPKITAGMTATDRAWLRGQLERTKAEAVAMMERRQSARLRGRSDALRPG